MKISVLITTILVAQVSASFFDVFHGAVLSVQNSFGKLLSDVVTDVKETVDCTILAVEHVLSLSHDATQRYYDKCGSVTNKTDSVSEAQQDASVSKLEVTFNLPNNSEYLQNMIPAGIDARINETLSKVLGNYKPYGNVLSIENVLAKESEQLAGVSVLVKKELDKLSHDVTTDLKKIEKQRDSEPSVDTILQEIKVLQKREQNTKNTSEAREIHQVIDQVLGKLDAIEVTEASENIKLEEILKDLESNSNNSFVGLRQQFEEWKEEEARHLSEIKSRIEEHEKISDHPGSYDSHGFNHPQPVIFNIDMNRDDVEPIKNSQETSNENTTQAKEKLDNNTSPKTIGDSNDTLISVANEPSSFQNNIFKESELNNTAITITLYSTTDSPFGSKVIDPLETPTAVGSDELATLSTTLQNNLTRNDTNETMTNTTLGNINIAPVNETMPPIVLLANLDKQESTSVTANEPTTILSLNENNFNETVTVGNPLQPPEITAIRYVILRKEESSDSATNNDTAIISAAETAQTEMTSKSHSNSISKDIVISSIANTMVESTSVHVTSPETVESPTSATNELVTTLITFDVTVSNDTMLTSTSSSISFSTPINVTMLASESSTATANEESSTVTARIISDNDSNNTMLPSTSSPYLERTPISEIIEPAEITLASGKDQSTKELYDTKISSTYLPNVENTPVSVTTQPEETGTTFDNQTFSTVTTQIVDDNDSKITMITNDSSPIVENTSVNATVEPKETTTGNEEFSKDSNGTMVTSTSLPIIESTLINGTIQPEETTTDSSNKEFSTETTSQLTTSSKIVNENVSDTSITSTPTPIISTSGSETSHAVDTKTVFTSDEDPLSSTAHSPSGTLNTANDDDNSSLAVVTMTPETISESIPQENIAAAENDETASTTNSQIASPATLINTNSNTDAIISTTFPTAEITTISEIIEQPVESVTPTKNEEPSILSTTSATMPDKVTNENTDSNDTATNADSVAVTEIIQTVEFTKAPEEQELSSTSTTTQSAINEIMTTITVFPPTESMPTSESLTAYRNEEDLKNSPKLEANTSRNQEIVNSPDLNFRVSPPLANTESAPINGEELTSNTPHQQNYDTAPILLQTRQPLINPEVPMYGQAAFPTRTLLNGASKLLTPDRLIPNVPNQQHKLENDALQQAALDFFDSIDERLLHSDSPFGPEEDIPKIANIPSPPLITNAPRKPIDPQRMNYENPSYVPTPKQPTGPPYSLGDRAPANTYRPQGLSTHRPKTTAAPTNNYKSPSMDYDSFFHSPPRDSEAHQRALKEARQLIANSKRSARIINSIMKNRNKYNARSVFG